MHRGCTRSMTRHLKHCTAPMLLKVVALVRHCAAPGALQRQAKCRSCRAPLHGARAAGLLPALLYDIKLLILYDTSYRAQGLVCLQGVAGTPDAAAGARVQLLAAAADAALDGSAPPVAAPFLTCLTQRFAPSVLHGQPASRVRSLSHTLQTLVLSRTLVFFAVVQRRPGNAPQVVRLLGAPPQPVLGKQDCWEICLGCDASLCAVANSSARAARIQRRSVCLTSLGSRTALHRWPF